MLSFALNYWQKSFMCCVRPSDKHRPWQVPSMSQPPLCWAQNTTQKITRKMDQRWLSAERGNRHQDGVISLTKCLCYTHMVIAALYLIHNGQKVGATQVPMDGGQINGMWSIAYNGIWRSLEKEGHSAPASRWMDLEDMELSNMSQTQKDKPCPIPSRGIPPI